MLIQVTLSKNIFTPLTYRYTGDIDLKIGTRVIVPLQNRLTTGWVLHTNHKYGGRVKKVVGIINDPYIPDHRFLTFTHQLSHQYICSQGIILDYSLPPNKKGLNHLFLNIDDKPLALKNLSLEKIKQLSKKKPLNLFYKSKTEPPNIQDLKNQVVKIPELKKKYIISRNREKYYAQIIKENTNQKKNILLLTSDNITARYLKEIFSHGLLYISDLSPKQRERIWEEVQYKNNQLIIGGLSAAFLPITNLGSIIFERATLFKSIGNPYLEFNIHEVAKERAKIFQVNYYEGGITHSLESMINAKQEDMIGEEEGTKGIREVEVRRLQNKSRKIPDHFLQTIRELVADNKRVLVLVNKKKSFDFPYCFKCDTFFKCPDCKGILREDNQKELVCLICKNKFNLKKICSQCNQELEILKDISLETIRRTLFDLLGGNRIFFADQGEFKKGNILRIRIQEYAVTISSLGIISPYIKGIFDYIIYLKPESFFDFNNYFSSEMIFLTVNYLKELIKDSGKIIVYSAFFFHYALKYLNNEKEFFNREKRYRNWFLLPPFFDLYKIEVREKNLRSLGKKMRALFKKYQDILKIQRIYIESYKKTFRTYKGILEIHTKPKILVKSHILKERGIFIRKIK